MSDRWDRRALELPQDARDGLVALAAEFLLRRSDAALGLAPARLLPRGSSWKWILYWCAARRVDDSVESGTTTPEHWEHRIGMRNATNLAERCLQSLMATETSLDLRPLLRRSLRGLAMEATFTRVRPFSMYKRLLLQRSVPTMEILDAWMFPREEEGARRRHAQAFAISAQVGDDCRDVLRDMDAGRVFVTKEEVDGAQSLHAFVRTRAFSRQRARTAAAYLDQADAVTDTFSHAGRRLARRLHGAWRHAIDSGQVRPTRMHLRLPT